MFSNQPLLWLGMVVFFYLLGRWLSKVEKKQMNEKYGWKEDDDSSR